MGIPVELTRVARGACDESGGGLHHEVGGIVAVAVDSHLQLTAVRLLDASIEASERNAVEKAIIEAVNGAMPKVVKSSAESLSQLQSSDDWKSAVGEVFGGGAAR